MPALYILGGANGAGKTTWYQQGLRNNSIEDDLPFLNVYMIVLRELGLYTAGNIAMAEQIAKARMRMLIAERKDFVIDQSCSISPRQHLSTRLRMNHAKWHNFFVDLSCINIPIVHCGCNKA